MKETSPIQIRRIIFHKALIIASIISSFAILDCILCLFIFIEDILRNDITREYNTSNYLYMGNSKHTLGKKR